MLARSDLTLVNHASGNKMRLICPNCDAQYEVPDEVIPASGRDVQCSNCGHTWFQHHTDDAPDEAETEARQEPDPDEEVVQPPEAAPAPQSQPQRRELDPAVADILRQEAEAEQAARSRSRHSDPLESQPDLGLDDAEPALGGHLRRMVSSPRDDEDEDDTDDTADHGPVHAPFDSDRADAEARTRAARERMARMRGEPVADDAAHAAAISSRRDLLPDIDEINSTLRSSGARRPQDKHAPAAAEPATVRQKRRGFRLGFAAVLALGALLFVLYGYAPDIAEAVPQADPYLSAYVAQVDAARLWLDGQAQGLLRWLDTIAQQSEA